MPMIADFQTGMIRRRRRMIVYDDLESREKIKIYDSGIALKDNLDSVAQIMINYRVADVWIPHLNTTEAAIEIIYC